MLDYSKIEAGKLHLEASEFDLSELVASTMAPFLTQGQEKGLELVCRISPDIPERLLGHPGQLRQVLLNLVSNAVKLAARGHVTITVVPQFDDATMKLTFAVQDTGMGVPPDKLEAIFEAFIQAEASIARSYGGTGLGLPISAGLVQLMGGQLDVDSQPGQGAVFSFSLPFARESPKVPSARRNRGASEY